MWCFTSHRRLKNVIIVLEWIPDTSALETTSPSMIDSPEPLTHDQEGRLQRAFEMFNISRTGNVVPTELRETLKAVGLPSEEITEQVNQLANGVRGGTLNYQEFKNMVVEQSYTKAQRGRYFVALSLDEAETIRGVIHSPEAQAFLATSRSAIGIRCGSLLLDSTPGFQTAPHTQQVMAEVNYRYFDSQLYYTEEEIGSLLRALQDNPPERREGFFQEIRSCRRRKRKDWQNTPLSVVFTSPDW
jgi:hypothetical protein